MILSQSIARMIEEMLTEAGGEISLVRNELALRFGCVPSQINYVIASRFTPERGYVVESRRGGGGFIRIRKVVMEENELIRVLMEAVSGGVDFESVSAYLVRLAELGMVSDREKNLILAACSDRALALVERGGRDLVRAGIFRAVLLGLLEEKERRG
jgi:transcriptional regulator CtsR